MSLQDMLTIPLKQAQELLSQPTRPTASPEAYADETDKESFKRDLPNFFRQAAAQMAQAEQVRQAQQTEFDARTAEADAARAANEAFNAEVENAPAMTTSRMDMRDPRYAGPPPVMPEESLSPDVPITVGPGAPTGAYNPLLQETITPVVENSAVGRGLGWLKDKTVDALAPVGHAIEDKIKDTGQVIQRLPDWVPGDERVGTAIESLPLAAARFKQGFAEGFEEQHHVPLSIETAKSALFAEFRNEVNLVSMWSDRILTDYTIDPALHMVLPDFLADPAVKTVGFAAQILPWAVVGIIGGVPAGIAMTATFATLAAEDSINLLGAYQRGQIDGKTLALGIGLNSIDLADPWTGHLLGRATAGFRNRGAVQAAIRDIEAITGNKLDTPQVNRGINAAEELQRKAPSYEQLADEKFGEGASLTREERMARAAEGVGPEVAPIPEQVAATVPEPGADAVQAAPVGPLINEEPQTPIDVRLDRHRLTTPEGDRLDYRGSHINDVTVQVERQGRGTALLNRAIDDIRARDPGAVITADMNSEGGARLFAGQAGVKFSTLSGDPLTPEEAIAAAIRREGPIAELPPATAAADVPATVKEPVAAIGTTTDAPAVASPVDATNKAGEDGWTKKTFDKVERRRVEQNQYGEVWERRDGKFDMVDSRWASMERGQTAGAGSDNIRTFDSIDDARASLEELTARFSKPPEARAEAFRADAARAIEDADAVKEAEKVATKPSVVREAEDVAATAQPELTAKEEVSDLTGYRKRVLLDATETSRAEQAYGPMVKDTMGENGGATYDPRSGKAVPYKAYFVGGYAPTKRVKASEFSSSDLAAYVKTHFDTFKDGTISLGTERVTIDGVEYINIDAVRNMPDRGKALNIARLNGEERIWDANNDAPIDVPGTKKTATSVRAEPKVDTPKDKFFDGETGAIDYARIGAVASDWVKAAGAAVKRVLAAIKELGRTFNNSELGAIRLGKDKTLKATDDDILDFGASRRWLFPDESWTTWAQSMHTKVGGTVEFWNSRRGDIRIHTEKMMGLMGDGPQGVTNKEVRFGNDAGPATFTRLKALADEGAVLHQNGKAIDMRKWYDKFWPFMKEHFGDDAEMMTRMAAMTQANNSPASGVSIAMRAYVQWKLGDPISRMGSRTIRNEVEAFLMGHVPTGPKINPFWEALRFVGFRGRNAVAVDRWVIGAMGARFAGPGMDVKTLQGNHRFIRFSQELIRTASVEAKVSPQAFQAAIWGGFRKEWDGMLKAAGGRPMGGDNDFFENLFMRTFKEFSLRSPSDFRLNATATTQRQLSLDSIADDMVEEWQQLRAREAGAFLGTSTKNADAILKTQQMNEWNTKIAAAHMLDTGEVPAHLKTPEVIDEVVRLAQHHKRAFVDRVSWADDATLRSLKDIPAWQKRVVDDALDQRKRSGETFEPAWTALPKDEQKRLQLLGWMRIPDNPRAVARTQTLLDELDDITTEQQLIRWMNKKGTKDIVGDKQAFIGKMTESGETYVNSAGKETARTEASPYWEPRSFYENRLVLNVAKVKAELRRRFPIDRDQSRPLAATMKLKQVGENLGACGVKVAGE